MNRIFVVVIIISTHLANAQNVGIGTNSPFKAKLQVEGSTGSTTAIFGGESSGISFRHSLPAIGYNNYHDINLRNLSTGFSAAQTFNFQNGRMFFDIHGYTVANGFSGAGKTAMMITAEGQATIGEALFPTTTLRVVRGSAPDGTAMLEGAGHFSCFNYGPEENTYIRAGKNGGKVFINDVPGGKIIISGNVGINTATPAWPLEIRQANNKGLMLEDETSLAYWEWRGGESDPYSVLNLFYNGTFKGGFNNVFGTHHFVSDARVKTNINPLGSIINKIRQLRPVNYQIIGDNASSKKSIGFIAQEVMDVFPELISVFKDSATGYNIKDLYTINYDAVYVLAIKGIQEQQLLLQAQKQRRKRQKVEIEGLNKKLNGLTVFSSSKNYLP